MSTETITPAVEATPQNIIKERSTYSLVQTVKTTGEKEINFQTENAATKAVEAYHKACEVHAKAVADEKAKAIAENREVVEIPAPEEVTIVLSQSFLKPQVNNFAGITELFANSEKEAAKLTNRGVDQKSYQYIRSALLEQNDDGDYVFQPVEGDIDLTDFVASESANRASSPEAKLEKILTGLDDATAAAMLAKLMAKFAGNVAAPVA